MRIILASKSPRRIELMNLLNIKFEIIKSDCKEENLEGVSLEENSKHLAYIKAKKVFDETSGDRVVIGSDTIVYKDGRIMGKPKTEEEAIKMLKNIKNNVHQVSTGLAVLIQKGDKYIEEKDCSISNVYVKDMTDEEINNWINTGKAYDRAGAYGIQDEFAVFIDKIEGNYLSIVGLPIDKLYRILKKNDII